MNDQFSMFDPKTSEALPSATSSQGSEAGPTRSDLPYGPTTDQSGPPRSRASRSARRASNSARPTNDIFGPLDANSSPSADLQRSLENRLRASLDVNGSPEYALTWKHWDMPAGLPICALRARAHRTSDSDCSGWPTATLAGWVTPSSRDWKDTPGMSTEATNPDGTTRKRVDQLPRQAALTRGDLGTGRSGSPAATGKPAALNPAFSLWLMGYPIEWARCAERVTRSSRKSPRPS